MLPRLLSNRKVDPDLAREVAGAFIAARSAQRDPLVRAAYEQLERQSDRALQLLTRRQPFPTVRVVFSRCRTPYASDLEMIAAVRTDGLLEVTSAATDRDRRHPLMGCDVGGAYDRFRAVHDIVGHVHASLGFDRDGEFAAWLTQERLYFGLARWALATELHAEHSVRWTTGVLSDHKATLLDRDLLARTRRGRRVSECVLLQDPYDGRMQRTSFEDMNCSVAQCLEIVGEWWSLLIVRDAFLGVTRFDDFQARLGISRNILNHRLNHLVDNGVLKRVPYEDHPPRSEYRLTDKGRDLWGVVTAMRQWGDRWAAPDGAPLRMRHKACGHLVKAVPVCSHCGEPLDLRSVTAEPGPGAVEGDFDRTRLAHTKS